jgi:ParB-like chromosome segregation protein Spo0J
VEIIRHIVASNIVVLERIRKDYGDIPALAESIKSEGLRNPIHVIESRNGQYVLLAGERRLEAVMLLGEPLIAVRVIEAKIKPENFYRFHRNYQTAKSTIKNKIMIKNLN